MDLCITILHTVHTSKGSVEALLDNLISRGFNASMEEQSFVQVRMSLLVLVTMSSILKETASSLHHVLSRTRIIAVAITCLYHRSF